MEEGKNKPAVCWIYILECENGNYYTGYTKDLAKRYQQHLNGKVKYTNSFKPIRIAQSWQIVDEVGVALKIERFIKRQDKKTKELLIQHPDQLKEMITEKLKIDVELLPCDPTKVELKKCPTD